MNTEQLKTADEFLHAYLMQTLRETFPKAHESKLINYMAEFSKGHTANAIVKAMQDFASQESKLAVEKDRESRWINRTDRLPEPKDANRLGEVLSLDDKGIVTTIHFNNVRGFDQYTFWQPLPEPPKQLTP